ncbi:MAG: hypothetical protein ACXWE1_01945, partial [Thermoanaerobaculia bacterium]
DATDAARLDAVLEVLSFERRAKDARAFEWLASECGFEATLARGACRRPWEERAGGPGRRTHPGATSRASA